MQLDELLFIVDWPSREAMEEMDLGKAEVFELGFKTCSPREMWQHEIAGTGECKWEDLCVYEAEWLEKFRKEQQKSFERLKSKSISSQRRLLG